MLHTLRAWLNGDREYFAGVVLYSKVGGNDALLNLFKKGKSDYTNNRLQEELLSIFNQLKSKENGNPVPVEIPPGSSTDPHVPAESNVQQRNDERPVPTNHATLYNSCKHHADKTYKEVMNMRAELFALARRDDFEDPNTPDKIAAREKLAISVVTGFQKTSQLYDKADYVKHHGKLPNDNDEEEPTADYDALPDHLVKQTLDNIRKNYNKMKKREATPERLALLQKHKSNIEKLAERWRLLKPVQ